MSVSKDERLFEFFRRLALAPPAGSEHDALELIAVTLTAVEDEMTDVPARSKSAGLTTKFSFAKLVATGGTYGIASRTSRAAPS